jgi:DeoR/GlpR family transcriptional regulator of sugar metabolism
MSSSSLDHTSVYHQDEQVVRIKQAMMKAAKLRVLGVDASKLEQSAAFKVAELQEFDVVLCTDNLSDEAADRIRSNGVNLKIVKLL